MKAKAKVQKKTVLSRVWVSPLDLSNTTCSVCLLYNYYSVLRGTYILRQIRTHDFTCGVPCGALLLIIIIIAAAAVRVPEVTYLQLWCCCSRSSRGYLQKRAIYRYEVLLHDKKARYDEQIESAEKQIPQVGMYIDK